VFLCGEVDLQHTESLAGGQSTGSLAGIKVDLQSIGSLAGREVDL
jgi:hypothetical protein